MTTKTTTEPKTLQELFSRDDSWCKGDYAKNEDNIYCHWSDSDAIQYCLVGAINKIYGHDALYVYKKIQNYLNLEPYGIITYWNDSSERTIDDVRKLVKELNI